MDDEERRILLRIQDRLLWLTTNTIHHANSRRANASPERVGGHQSSSTSVLTLLTALYFKILRPGDRIAVKPTAAPVFYAIQVLRGLLPPAGLQAYRSLGGLQAYPSRAKNPDWFDFSTGSMGLGAVAPAFAALLDRYVLDRFGGPGTLESGQPRRRGAPAEHRAGGRRGAGRGQRLGGLDRGGDGRPGGPRGRRRPEPAEPRSGRGGPPEPAARAPLPGARVARRVAPLRATPRAVLRRARRELAPRAARAHGQPGIPCAPSAPAGRGAQGARRGRAAGSGGTAGRARRRGGGRPARRSGGPRPGRDRRRVRGGRYRLRPAGGDPGAGRSRDGGCRSPGIR